REVYFYANRMAGEKMDPLIAEYLRFVVSRAGRALIMKDGKYLPLTAEAARAQLIEIEKIGSESTGEGG
ncbi:MAG: phosphate-binding protein, partial [Sphingopyxis sp.]|nr:phosphate-binding protein [Sphingopyxis sp.]